MNSLQKIKDWTNSVLAQDCNINSTTNPVISHNLSYKNALGEIPGAKVDWVDGRNCARSRSSETGKLATSDIVRLVTRKNQTKCKNLVILD